MNSMDDGLPKSASTPEDWLAAVCAYFRDFLETDFKKTTAPKRVIGSRDKDGNLVGVEIAKYPELASDLWSALAKPTKSFSLKVRRGKYRSRFSKNLSDLIEKQVLQIDQTVLDFVQGSVISFAKGNFESLKNDPENFANQISNQLRNGLLNAVINPLLGALESYFTNRGDQSFETIFNLEEELGQRIVAPLADGLSVAIASTIVSKRFDDLTLLLTDTCRIDTIRSSCLSFFDGLTTTDFFDELSSLKATTKLRENFQTYLYVGTLRLEKHGFPLFYMPIEVELNASTFSIEIEPRVLVNKRAIDHVIGVVAKQDTSKPLSFTLAERILYLDSEVSPTAALQNITDELVIALGLQGAIDFGDPLSQRARSSTIAIENSLFVATFDQSDESILNDYEELITGLLAGSSEAQEFKAIVEGFIHRDPVSIDADVDKSWREREVEDRLVYASPVALNEEQQKIISGLNNKDCRFLAVEGPPGTGKSHTITACVFDYILKGKNVLILSDKKEALDVAEDKIRQTLQRVRVDENLQDPILRLGKHGNSYTKILSSSTLTAISNSQSVARARQSELKSELEEKEAQLRSRLKAFSTAVANIDLKQVAGLHAEEIEFDEIGIDFQDCLNRNSFRQAIQCANTLLKWTEDRKFQRLLSLYGCTYAIESLKEFALIQEALKGILHGLVLSPEIFEFSRFDANSVIVLERIINELDDLRKPLIGFAFSKREVRALVQSLVRNFGYRRPDELPQRHEKLRVALDSFRNLLKSLDESEFADDFFKNAAISQILGVGQLENLNPLDLAETVSMLSHAISSDQSGYLAQLGFRADDFTDILSPTASRELGYFVRKVAEHISYLSEIEEKFDQIPELDYATEVGTIQHLQTQALANVLDGRVLEFANNHRNQASQIKQIIQKKQQFPKEMFSALREAFPIMIAGIRDFAEYVPLKRDLFDLLIIDEGSQVSIAQALPSFLRAKKVLVLGDRKQFSNVKTETASKQLNQSYKANVLELFRAQVSTHAGRTNQVEAFDIKTSVLDFVEKIANLKIMLRKHFRGYPELIGFSSKFFYGGSLQAVKIRGVPVSEVIQFKLVKHDGKLEANPKTNRLEAEAIVAELEEIANRDICPSVCVITPHTEQQKLIYSLVNSGADGAELIEKLKLRVFTFDTCQGEERDVVIYSMVATRELDRLAYIFPSDMNKQDDVEESLRLQRLNVGFSRAKEKIVIYLSKPQEEFKGGIGTALQHFNKTLADAAEMPGLDEVDSKSPMEIQVLHWLRQVPVLEEYAEGVEIDAQFEIGKYLRQLDSTYRHPLYKVDFLIKVLTPVGTLQVVVEYDGFKEHFVNRDMVGRSNYDVYMRASDVERQMVLEGYGYKFLRINRFNVGEDPVATLDYRLRELIENFQLGFRKPEFIDNLQLRQRDLAAGKLKVCPKCSELRDIESFFDPSLAGGRGAYGRLCRECKGRSSTSSATIRAEQGGYASRVFLNCPFADKDECKKLGGRWDPYRKKWYITSQMDQKPFSKWLR